MPYQLYSTYQTGNGGSYGDANAAIGVILSAVQNLYPGLVTVISDNNPPVTSMRTVVFQVGDSGHYIKLQNQSNYLYHYIMNLANTSSLGGQSETSGNWYTSNAWVKVLAGPNSLVLESNYPYHLGFAFVKGDDGHWYGRHYYNSWYPYNGDYIVNDSGCGSNYRNAAGQTAFGKKMFNFNSVWLATCPAFLAGSDGALGSGVVLNDGTYNWFNSTMGIFTDM
ncbi:hypothetical protein JCM15765_39900 [Paradesulfitobacterium aromaticivorans]